MAGHQGDVSAANGGGMGIQFGSLALVAEFLVADVPSQEILQGFVFLCQYGVLVDFGEK